MIGETPVGPSEDEETGARALDLGEVELDQGAALGGRHHGPEGLGDAHDVRGRAGVAPGRGAEMAVRGVQAPIRAEQCAFEQGIAP